MSDHETRTDAADDSSDESILSAYSESLSDGAYTEAHVKLTSPSFSNGFSKFPQIMSEQGIEPYEVFVEVESMALDLEMWTEETYSRQYELSIERLQNEIKELKATRSENDEDLAELSGELQELQEKHARNEEKIAKREKRQERRLRNEDKATRRRWAQIEMEEEAARARGKVSPKG
ncbi:hypothetical protein KVT40_003404 [Elsinoe batatas]|uniref:Uncharacterized protein n=1 Tax=Elsinoe batatas TaxID=2601811 RepID=A0A8K0L4H6_9PEZI|nr:hypothetical protein KVT40_003404 [Elsinoe batatas]